MRVLNEQFIELFVSCVSGFEEEEELTWWYLQDCDLVSVPLPP